MPWLLYITPDLFLFIWSRIVNTSLRNCYGTWCLSLHLVNLSEEMGSYPFGLTELCYSCRGQFHVSQTWIHWNCHFSAYSAHLHLPTFCPCMLNPSAARKCTNLQQQGQELSLLQVATWITHLTLTFLSSWLTLPHLASWDHPPNKEPEPKPLSQALLSG